MADNMEFIKTALLSPLFFVTITIFALLIGKFVEDRLKIALLNKFIVALLLILLFLFATGTEYEQYKKGGDIVSLFLGPATVALAIPLYEQLELLIKNRYVVLIGIFCGCVVSFLSIFISVKLCQFAEPVYLSMLPKSVTTPIAIILSEKIGGVPALTTFSVIIAGLVGGSFLPGLAKLFAIKEKVAIGLAAGTASHVIGTTKALEAGAVEGAFSSLAVSVAGIMTVVIVPLLMLVFKF